MPLGMSKNQVDLKIKWTHQFLV